MKNYKTQLEKEIEELEKLDYSDYELLMATNNLDEDVRKMFKNAFRLCGKEAKLEGYNQARKEELEFLKEIDEILFDEDDDFADSGDLVDCCIDRLKERVKELQGEKI